MCVLFLVYRAFSSMALRELGDKRSGTRCLSHPEPSAKGWQDVKGRVRVHTFLVNLVLSFASLRELEEKRSGIRTRCVSSSKMSASGAAKFEGPHTRTFLVNLVLSFASLQQL